MGDEVPLCRYCFEPCEGEGEGKLISPCQCAGGQKWCHLKCLRKWQRSLIVLQPTHPALQEKDDRLTICGVCKTEYTVPPPSRHEMMLGFTGPELASFLKPGYLIVSEKKSSEELEHILRYNSHIPHVRQMYHWVKGVYLIILLEEKGCSDGESDAITAVNLVRQLDGDSLPDFAERLERKVRQKIGKAEQNIIVYHFIGGPCDQQLPLALCRIRGNSDDAALQFAERSKCHVLMRSGNDGKGWEPKEDGELQTTEEASVVVIGSFHEVMKIAACEANDLLKGKVHDAKDDAVTTTVEEKEAEGRERETKSSSSSEKGKGAGKGKKNSGKKMVRVHSFWGYARWGHTQLLGEIARGSWGLTKSNTGDVAPRPFQTTDSDSVKITGTDPSHAATATWNQEELWQRLTDSDRPVYANENEMKREYSITQPTENEMRQEEEEVLSMAAEAKEAEERERRESREKAQEEQRTRASEDGDETIDYGENGERLPYGGDVQAAMRARDRKAIRTIMQWRNRKEEGK